MTLPQLTAHAPDTELTSILHRFDREYSLRHWLEEATGQDPGPEAMNRMETVADVRDWVERRVTA